MKEEIPAISFLSAGKRFEQNNTSFDVLSRVTGHIQKGSITALIGLPAREKAHCCHCAI